MNEGSARLKLTIPSFPVRPRYTCGLNAVPMILIVTMAPTSDERSMLDLNSQANAFSRDEVVGSDHSQVESSLFGTPLQVV